MGRKKGKPIKQATRAAKGAIAKVKQLATGDNRTSSTKGYSKDRPGLDPKEWCKLAKLKKGWKEIDLQHHIAEKLRASGYTLKENVEINLGGGSWCEADIVIYKDGQPWQVLEVKPYLDRGKVIEGSTQARAYTEHLKCSQQPILIGLAPYVDRAYWGGKNAIKTVAHNRVGVVYLNEDQNWIPQADELSFWDKAGIKLAEIPWKTKAPILLIFMLWGLLGGWEFSSKVFHPNAAPQCRPCPSQVKRP